MSMAIGGISSSKPRTKTNNNKNKTSSTRSITITKSTPKKKKRLNYNLKRISNQILMSKTSNTASRAVVSARNVVASLQRKLRTGDYNDQDVERALIHAKKMARIAKKRMKHMKEEEMAAQSGSCLVEGENDEALDMQDENEENSADISAKEMEEMMRELEELMQETLEDSLETSLREMAQELIGSTQQNMDPEELERLKKKHRASELQEIVRADMEYLKALFDKLAKEKQSSSSGSSNSQSAAANNISGVTLQLSGAEIPVDVPEAPVTAEGANMDVLV